MTTEIELKFDLAPEARGRLTAAATALAGANPRRRRMRSLYFDTPERALAQREMALRLRREGRRWVQTLKAGRSGTGGLHRREEWENARPGPTLDLSVLAETPLARLDGARIRKRLGPVFEVNFTRTAWQLAPAPGCRLEIALDMGEVASGRLTAPICEVEIECLEGDPGRAFDLAARLMEEVALHPSATSKAQRGYRLARDESTGPVKSARVRLDAAMTPLDAARVIVAAGIAQLQANEEGVLASNDPEFVHQARVALRRTRSALRLFRREIGEARVHRWLDALGETARALGRSRDWDVFATRSIPAALEAFGDAALARSLRARVAHRRRLERVRARETLRSPHYAEVLLDLARWLAGADGDGAGKTPAEPLADFAARVIRKRHRKLLAGALALGDLTPAELHRVRIDTKRLRYGVDSLAALFKPRPLATFAASLEAMQESLGDSNDAATALRLLAELAAPETFAAFARGWFASRERGDAAVLEPIVAQVARHRRTWLRLA